MKLSTQELAAKLREMLVKAQKLIIRLLFFTPIGFVLGLGVGMRLFETGRVIPGMLKGSTIRISGVCLTDGKPRLPALADDQVTVTSIKNDILTGVIRKTREAITCDLSEIALDALPLIADLMQNPAPPPEITPAKIVEDTSFGQDLINRTFKISGACQNTATGNQEALLDAVVVFTSAKKKEGQSGGTLLAVVKSEGRSKGASIQCDSNLISYEPAVLEESTSNVQVALPEEDLKGKYIVITSTCFPDKRFKKAGDDNLFFHMINDLVQVTDYQKVDGKIEWLTGAHINKGSMIECDAKKYPITWRMYDASTMKLTPVQKNEK